MRLIDANTLQKRIDEETEITYDGGVDFNELVSHIKNEPTVEAIPISWINEIAHRDICLIYRAVLMYLIEKWREESNG